jgi:hypothetical protein
MTPASTSPRRQHHFHLTPCHYLLLSLLALLLLLPFVPQTPAGVAIFLTTVCAVLVTGVVAAGVTRRCRTLALGIALPTVLCLVAYSLIPAPGPGLAARLTCLALHVSMTWSLLRTLLDHPTVWRGPEVVSPRLMRRAAGQGTGRMRGRWVGLVACVLLTGCGLTFPRLSQESPTPTVTFATPAAWGCRRQTQTLPTPKGTLEACTVCRNIARTGQDVTINKEAHTVPPQGRVAMCESSAFVTTE